MKTEERTLTFRIDGEFVTRLAREQFHYEGRMEYAKELLASCMVSDQITENDRNAMIINILDGRAELRGVYPDGDFGFHYLEEADKRWSMEKTFAKMKQEAQQAKEQLEDLQEKYFFVCESLDEWERRKLQREFKEEFEKVLFEDIVAETTSTGSALLDSFLKRMQSETDDDYGWLEPNGEFHAVEWGDHQKWAYEWLEENLSEEEFEEFDIKYTLCEAGDELTKRGWILLHNPSQGIAFPTRDESREMTKAQKEFLYDYYIERNCQKEANEIWK